MKKFVALIVVTVSLIIIPPKAQPAYAKEVAIKDCPGHVAGVRQYRKKVWKIQDRMGAKRYPSSFNPYRQGCGYAKMAGSIWRTRLHKENKKLSEWKTLSATRWVLATAQADRVFPGTRQWLLNCSGGTTPSNGEGGWGGFVYNMQGSGAGGWLQFLHSTYLSYARAAFAAVRARGFIVNESHNDWHDPLGQAIVGGHMRSLGISHYHWDPDIDAACE